MRQIYSTSQFRNGRTLSRLVLAGAAVLLAAASVKAQSFSTVLATNLFQPTAIAATPLNRYVVSDSGNNRVIEFSPDTFVFTVLAGGEAGAVDGGRVDARFRSPQGLLTLPDGVVVADSGNNLIRKISYQGQVETIAGNLALAHEADEFGGTPANGGAADGPALSASFRNPAALAYDGQNLIFIADTGNRSVRVLNLATKTVSTLVSSGLTLPTGLAVGRDGDLYISDSGAHSIKRWRNGQLQLIAGRNSAFDSGLRNSSIATNALFRSPRAIYYREAKDELVVVDTGNSLLRVIQNVSTSAPSVDTFANSGAAGLVTPVGIARDSAGIFLVVDAFRSAIISVITVLTPRVTDPAIGYLRVVTNPDTGQTIAILVPVTDQTFHNDEIIAIGGEIAGVHHYVAGPGPTNILQGDTLPAPTENSATAPNFVSPGPPSPLPLTLAPTLPVLRIKAMTTGPEGEERIPSRVVEATFRFRVATPDLNSKEIPGALVFRSETANASIWYTLDGSDPVNDTNVNPNVRGPVLNGDSIPLVIGKEKVVVKARGFRASYRESSLAIAEFSPSDFVPNRISLGFEYGEASSAFIGAAGQRFFSPVTLSVLPGARAYGLQFNLSIDPGAGSPGTNNYGLAFESMLDELLPTGYFRTIPPQTFTGLETNVESFAFTNSIEGRIFTNLFNVTNYVQIFSNLVFTNISERLMGVGWIERLTATNLYNTRLQDLITYSLPHDTLFLSANGKVVPGGFSFVVPRNAEFDDTYTLRVDRPSATADGIGRDIYIQAPGLDEVNSPVKAVRELRIGVRTYVVGDLAPFRWFNAGDFGDTNILNNDITQLQQSIVYGFNYPPRGSDFFDAMDSCCVTLDGTDLSASLVPWDGNESSINQIAFGDGILDVMDLYVTFRRSLDPSLAWYARYWSNGVRNATIVNNNFRPEVASLSRQSAATTPPQNDPVIQTPDRPALTLSIASATALAGQTVSLPISAEISGGYPLRALMFKAVVETLEGTTVPGQLTFIPGALGAPTIFYNHQGGSLGAAWLNTDADGILGSQLVGTIQFQIPETASPASIFRVKFERVSGSPNGISRMPISTADGVISMANRPAVSSWTDGISDAWRALYFGSASAPYSHSMLDPDHDGLSNMAEFKLGTNPMDSTDNLRVRATASAKNLRLRFRTAEGRKYLLEASDSLKPDSWRVVRPEIQGTGTGFETDESSNGSRLYYRLRLKE